MSNKKFLKCIVSGAEWLVVMLSSPLQRSDLTRLLESVPLFLFRRILKVPPSGDGVRGGGGLRILLPFALSKRYCDFLKKEG